MDIVGDLTDADFLVAVRKARYKSVLCSNLLEHIIGPEKICNAIVDVVEPGGYIVVTVPNLYPYHGDPIDTKFRQIYRFGQICRKSPCLAYAIAFCANVVNSTSVKVCVSYLKSLNTASTRLSVNAPSTR